MESLRYLWAPVFIFIGGFLLLRLAGKRAVANMSNFDLFLVTSMGSAMGGFITQNSLPKTLAGVAMLVLTYLGFSFLALNNTFRKWFMAKPSVLVTRGHVNERGLRDARMTIPELLGHLRIKGYSAIQDVEFAVMEEAGEISVIPKSDNRPVQPGDLHIQVPPATQPVPVIVSGSWIDDNLKVVNKDRAYVIGNLRARGIQEANIQALTLVTVDQRGIVWVDVDDIQVMGGNSPKQYESPEQADTGVLSPQAEQVTQKNDVEN
ncbi:MAG TPA: DUF421 domain-containing protein [Bacilli bacterium]|nr:DUF421 domain-containing protein [Bacilli bacterium]